MFALLRLQPSCEQLNLSLHFCLKFLLCMRDLPTEGLSPKEKATPLALPCQQATLLRPLSNSPLAIKLLCSVYPKA